MVLKTKAIWLCLSLALSLFTIQTEARVIPDSKRQLIDTIMKLTGTAQALPLMTNQLSGEILGMLKAKNVEIDQNLILLVQKEAKTVVYEEFVLSNKFNEIFYELYDEYFSEAQLKDIAAFYESSAGKRLLIAMPDISRRSIDKAQEHSKGMGLKVQQRLMKRFDELDEKIAKQKREPNPKEQN